MEMTTPPAREGQSETQGALADRLEAHTEQMANTSWGLTMQEWNVISNDILLAARTLRARHNEVIPPLGFSVSLRDGQQAHADRATLLRLLDAERACYKSTSAAANNVIDGLTAELSAERARRVEVERWQPIETAPKDGTQILACAQLSEHLTAAIISSQGHVPDLSIVRWDEREKDWVGMCDGYMSIKSQGDMWTTYHEPYVTHWQPLPTPPATNKDTQDE